MKRMLHSRKTLLLSAVVFLLALGVTMRWIAETRAQDFMLDVSSDGSDGALNITVDTEIDLGLAADAAWDGPSPVAGNGVYDNEKWAVVFKYTTVNIAPDVTVTFKNHRSRAPVVWLVQTDVLIDGTVNLNGAVALLNVRTLAEPGPGGFRGGYSNDVDPILFSGGFGPGGGSLDLTTPDSGGGSHSTVGSNGIPGITYGGSSILPLVGGSGGAGNPSFSHQGPGGGGAILIAAGGTITVNGSVTANGGSSTGFALSTAASGGGIRLVASDVDGTGRLDAAAGFSSRSGGHGRVRVEAFSSSLGQGMPNYLFEITADPPILWPPASSPTITVTTVKNATIGNLSVPGDPFARFNFPDADVNLTTDEDITVEVAATNLALTAVVNVRVVPKVGDDFTVEAAQVSGDATASVWEATFAPPVGFAGIQVFAELP